MKRQVRLHPAVILIAVTAGTLIAGIAGAFVAVPITAVVWRVIDTIQRSRDAAAEAGPRHPAPPVLRRPDLGRRPGGARPGASGPASSDRRRAVRRERKNQGRWVVNQAAVSWATCPGCRAPRTDGSRRGRRAARRCPQRRRSACWFSSITGASRRRRSAGSAPRPGQRRAGEVGPAAARDDGADDSRRSRRRAPAPRRAPVLAPNSPTGRSCAVRLARRPVDHGRPAARRADRCRSAARGSGRRRSPRRASADPQERGEAAPVEYARDRRLRGLCRLLPLPCANSTTPPVRPAPADPRQDPPPPPAPAPYDCPHPHPHLPTHPHPHQGRAPY